MIFNDVFSPSFKCKIQPFKNTLWFQNFTTGYQHSIDDRGFLFKKKKKDKICLFLF